MTDDAAAAEPNVAEYERRYLNDPEFHARVEAGTQAILRLWAENPWAVSAGATSPTTEGAQWEARMLSFQVVMTLDFTERQAAGEGEWRGELGAFGGGWAGRAGGGWGAAGGVVGQGGGGGAER